MNKRKIFLSVLIVVVFSLFISRTLFINSLPRTDDLELHGARVANYYLALKQGQFPPAWGPNLNHGFGYPFIEFSYHLPYLLTTFFYAMGASVEMSINLSIIIFTFSGGLGVFTFSLLKNKRLFLAIVSAIVYSSAPYILLNIFVRGALGEVSFLGILPWVIVFLEIHHLSHKWWYVFFSPIIFGSCPDNFVIC